MTDIAQNGGALKLYVRSIQARNNGAQIAVSVSVESGEHCENRCFLLTAGQYCELNVKKGELTEEAFDRLESASRFCQAVRCGENLLSYGANSVHTLMQKIMRHGYTKEEASSAADYLESIGLIDERYRKWRNRSASASRSGSIQPACQAGVPRSTGSAGRT